MRPDLHIELGGGAVLRAFTPDDLDALYEVIDLNRVRLARWFPWVDEATDAATQLPWLERAMADVESLDGNGIWVGGQLAGGCDLRIHRHDDIGELGFWLDEEQVGRGLVTRAGQALMTRGFEAEGLHRVQMRAGVENLRSRAVARRLKLKEEGVLRGAGKVGGGRYVDLVMYGLLVDDWRLG
jgi:ribosomal-protein-serine acetyltransferase